MDARTDFLTAPNPSPRGNDVLTGSGNGETSPSGAQFAGVLNGHMLKLERQALASSPTETVDLQVLRLGNKLNVITTDAPLPDLASLADFARAQGLGESAVRALFGNSGQAIGGTAQAQSLAIVVPSGLTATANAPFDGDTAQAAMALAQASAKDLLQTAASQGALEAVVGQTWLSLRAQTAAATAIGLRAEDLTGQALEAQTGLVPPDTRPAVDPALPLQLVVDGLLKPQTLGQDTHAKPRGWINGPQSTVANSAPDLEHALSARQAPGSADLDATRSAEAAAALAMAMQAGLGLAPMGQPSENDEAPVSLTSLTVKASGPLSATGEVILPALAQTKVALPRGAATLTKVAALTSSSTTITSPVALTSSSTTITSPVALASSSTTITSPVALVAGAAIATAAIEAPDLAADAPQADLKIRLIPPDQAITRRLAHLAGQSKSIDWSALLAGQKVSDTLAGLAHSPAPGLSDAQAKIVAHMQANGQLPASTDPARDALLAKLQAQAASVSTPSVSMGSQAAAQAAAATYVQPVVSLTPATQASAVATGLVSSESKPAPTPMAAALQTAAAAPTARPASLWESLRIEVPSGPLLEALQERQAQMSDAEPTLPTSAAASAGAASSLAHNQAADKAPATTPQALAEQRAAQYQQVADQLGEAMARRLIAQIERGQWKMQLRMQPAALGRIDVELDMHARGLDATFTSDNAITRELMAQGAARLRDTLTQTGTTVASVVVNGDSGRQSGGNSTPGHKPKSGQNAESKKSAAPAIVTTAAMPPTSQGDGLNVLA